jgi:hypothetical protein
VTFSLLALLREQCVLSNPQPPTRSAILFEPPSTSISAQCPPRSRRRLPLH